MAQSIVVKSKEIRVKNPEMIIEDENKAEIVEFSIFNANAIEGVREMAFYVQFRNKLGEVGMDVLENAYPSEIIHNDMLVLDWLPSASFSKERGKIEIQIIGFTESLVVTSDTKYQSGKMYFSDSSGTFLPVYPADSEHTPKVGGDITGTVYENQVTGDDHRWSTEKCQLVLPENIYDNGTPVYSEAQVKNLITQMNAQVALADADALKAEGFAVGKQNGVDVDISSEYYHNNAKYFNEEAKDHQDNAYAYKLDAEAARDKAEEWATKTDGKVDSVDYSAKYYANEAKEAVAPIEPYIDEIVAVGTNIQDITDVANALGDISAVKNNLEDIGKVADIDEDVSKVADIDDDVSDVASIKSDVSDVADIKSDVTNVSGIKSDVSAVSAIKSDVSAVAAIAEDVSAVNDNKTNIDTVASNISDIEDVATDLNDEDSAIKAVATDIENVNDVADDLANIDAVAADLTNIDNAEANALKAEGWANGTQGGTPVSSDSPYYHNNAKYWADAVPALNDALSAQNKRIENLEEAHGSYHEVDVKSVYTIPTGKGSNWLIDGLRGVSRARNNQAVNGNFATGDMTGWTDVSSGTSVISGNKIAYSWSVQYSNNGLANNAQIVANHLYLVFATVKNTYSETRNFRVGQPYGVQSATVQIASGATALVIGLLTPTTVTGNGYYFGLFGTQNGNYSCEMTDFVVTDLTVYFNNSIPTDADTIAEIQTNYPWLLTPSSYGTSMVKTRYEGFRSYDSSNNLIAEVILPTPIELGSAGSEAEEAYLNEDGEAWKTNPVGTANLATLNWYAESWGYSVAISDLDPPSGASYFKIITADYQVISPKYSGEMPGQPDKTICQSNNSSGSTKYIYVKDSEGTPSGTLYYQRDVPLADTPLTPVLDNLIKTEPGGTIESILTTPVDDSMTLGYINL